MALNVRNAEYFYVRIENTRESAYELLAQLASKGQPACLQRLAFGPNYVELTIFPDRSDTFIQLAKKLGWVVAGPQHAFLIQGDDRLGALADIQRMLLEGDVEIYASSGVTDGSGRFGYVIYFKEEDHERAARALGAVTLPKTA